MFADKKVGTFPVILFLTGLVVSLFPRQGISQEVIVCKSQQDGIPRGAAIEFKVDSFPWQLTLFYNHGKTTITERSINFIIEPEARTGIAPSEASVVVSQGRNWASTTFMFQHSGKYAISAYRSDNSVMATALITIEGPDTEAVDQVAVVADNEPAERKSTDGNTDSGLRHGEHYSGPQVAPAERVSIERPISEEEAKTLHFSDVNIALGTSISGGKLNGVSDRFADTQTRKGIVVQLSNAKPFGSDSITLDVWRKSAPTASDHDELIMNSDVAVNPKAYTVHAPLTLFKKGEYKVSFFTKEQVWIGSAYLSVR